MRHAMDHRKLRRNPGHRKALLRNLMNALVRSERIETTVAKAKELRRLADRLITLGKRNTTHARRLTFRLLSDKATTEKIFAGLAARFADRHGGYTRILRTGYRAGDGSEMAILEYLPAEEKRAGAPKGKKGKKTAPERGRKPAVPRKKVAPGAAAKQEPAQDADEGRAERKPAGKREESPKEPSKGARKAAPGKRAAGKPGSAAQAAREREEGEKK